ncbi:MAG: hypothetical protein ABI402_18205 [Ferruginibacter sp.]
MKTSEEIRKIIKSSDMIKATKKLAICMDHSTAYVMYFTDAGIEEKIMGLKLTQKQKVLSAEHGEKGVHHKEQHEQSVYYKELSELIKNYGDVILFGPTEAKVELFNILRADRHFEKIKIELQNADKMTQNQRYAFVKEYFSLE